MKKLENMEDLRNDLDYFFSTHRTPGRIVYLLLNILILILVIFFLIFNQQTSNRETRKNLTGIEEQKSLFQ